MKKLLSIVLITAMVLALVPSAFATTTETDTSNLVRAYNFDFGAAGYAGIDDGQTGETEIGYATLQQYGDTYATDGETSTRTSATPSLWAKTNTSPWVVDSGNRATNVILTSTTVADNKQANSLYWTTLRQRAQLDSTVKSAFCIAIRIKIDKIGTYTPKLNFFARNDSCIYNVYLMPKNNYYMSNIKYRETLVLPETGSNAIYTDANGSNTTLESARDKFDGKEWISLGSVDMYEDSTKLIQKPLNSFTITEALKDDDNEYILFFVSNGVNEKAKSLYTSANKNKIVYANVDSFELYREKTTEEKAAEESFDAAIDEDTTVTSSASVELFTYNGEESKTAGSINGVVYGESVEIPAVEKSYTDETTGKTYNFLYWAKGLKEGVSKQILSTSNAAFPYKPHEGANYLIAVYEEAGNAKEAFYNKNGQLLTDLEIKDNKLPALPAMAGRGDAIKWVQRGTNLEFDGGADVSNLEGDMVFMAKYDEPTVGNITINGNKYFYGDDVSCKDIVDSTENFSYWTRQIGDGDAEIISLDENYSFSAYTDCTIAAVCNGSVTLESPRKIALSTFSVGDKLTAVMAEFIGFEGAKEKGIMFGGKKIAMTTDKAQFTVTNDTTSNVEVTGYAIVGNDQYVDGKVTVDAAK